MNKCEADLTQAGRIKVNDNFGLKMDTSPALERGVVTIEKPQNKC
jgi:hypothetical protein